MLIQPVKFIQYRCSRNFKGWNTVEQIPQTFEMILHFTTAAHDIATARIEDTVTGPACNVHSFKNMNMLSRHLSVTNKETCRCQRSKTTAYDIGMLLIHTLRLFRSGKSFSEPEWQSAVGQWVLQAFWDKEGELLPLVQAPFIADAADVRGMKRPIIMGRIIDAAEWIKCMPIRNISLDIAISIIDRWIPENESTWYWQISPEGNFQG